VEYVVENVYNFKFTMWIETNYGDTIQKTSKKLGFDLKVI